MKRSLDCVLVLALTAALVCSSAVAQAPEPTRAAESQPILVNVPFFAEDSHGQQRSGITAADFFILDEHNPPQSIVAIRAAKDSPLRLGVLIDSSSSERASGLYKPGLSAINDWLYQGLNGLDDKVFIVNFSSTVQATGFMGKDEFLKSNTNVTPGGGTAFFDAVHLACKERMAVDAAKPARRVLVALTDGGDNMSHVSHNEAIAAAQKAGVVVFAVSTSEQGGDLDSARLKQIAEKTGGLAFLHLSAKDLPKVFRNIQQQIDSMYIVSYVPQTYGKQDSRRTIELKAVSDKKLKFRAPAAYYSAPSTP